VPPTVKHLIEKRRDPLSQMAMFGLPPQVIKTGVLSNCDQEGL